MLVHCFNLLRAVTVASLIGLSCITVLCVPPGFYTKDSPLVWGFWERLIGLTKTALRKVLGKALVILPVLQTVIVEIEAILNDRPLTYVSMELRDPEPLTSSHLLCG